jgi:hypothetical protein
MRVLFVSPRFPPSSSADSQRLRLLLPHLLSHGCTSEVLAADPFCCANGLDLWQLRHLPSDVPIHRVRGLSRRWSSIPSLGSIDSRCHRAFASLGSHLLSQKPFDLVYFSTTEFGSFRLGPLWKHRHGVPFVLDYQDPWVNDYYRQHTNLKPPGGRLKYSLVERFHRFHEPRVLQHAAGITAVSPAYPQQLQARYPFAATIPSLILPFPGCSDDFNNLDPANLTQLPFDPHDGLVHWVSIGRGGSDLHQALDGFFSAIARNTPRELHHRLRLHFIGTSYASHGKGIPSITPLAQRHGLGMIVDERTDRLPLSLSLAALKAADALLVIGSNDPSYTASKLYPNILARKPLLAILHEQSSAVDVLNQCGGGVLLTFNGNTSTEDLSARISQHWLSSKSYLHVHRLDYTAFEPHTASAQSARLVSFFSTCLDAQL